MLGMLIEAGKDGFTGHLGFGDLSDPRLLYAVARQFERYAGSHGLSTPVLEDLEHLRKLLAGTDDPVTSSEQRRAVGVIDDLLGHRDEQTRLIEPGTTGATPQQRPLPPSHEIIAPPGSPCSNNARTRPKSSGRWLGGTDPKPATISDGTRRILITSPSISSRTLSRGLMPAARRSSSGIVIVPLSLTTVSCPFIATPYRGQHRCLSAWAPMSRRRRTFQR